jgi:[acyl-carrier-protein] S-malonyltransferase
MSIPDGVPTSGFRNEISNDKRYMKHNARTIDEVGRAAHEGDRETLDLLLSSGNEDQLFNGDLNAHITSHTALHMAAIAGQTECIELLLKAGADPHVRENVSYGTDPEDGNTALDFAQKHGWDDAADVLTKAEKKHSYGWYVPEGPNNNAKIYGCWEWGKKPAKGWFMARPGAARRNGLDPAKYGFPEEEGEEEVDLDLPKSVVPRQPPVSVALLFPGQGSQYVKMFSSVKSIPRVQEMLDQAEKILGFNILELCLEGPESTLEETKNCQPAMFIAGLAGIEKLRAEREEAVERPQCLAGLSLGEYTALCHAGVFSFEDGLKLVKLRGEAMQAAASTGKQAMLSVAGVEKAKLEDLCKEAAKKEGKGAICQIANELFPKGFSCGGTEAAINALKDLTEKNGALQAKILKTAGGFHTPLMASAQEKLSKALDEMLPNMKPNKFTVYANATGEPIRPGTNPKVIVELLKKQLTNRVLWEPSVRAMIKEGIKDFYEVGPMKQIKAMMKRIDSKAWGSTTNIEV